MNNSTDTLALVQQLYAEHDLPDAALTRLIETETDITEVFAAKEPSHESDKKTPLSDCECGLFAMADAVRREHYGNAVYVRGLLEITNYCRNDCYYCGIRKSNRSAQRYRLDRETILRCCADGYVLGFRTFVLQGGEDAYFTDALICDIVSAIKTNHPDSAVTLSLGEKSRNSYQTYYDAGADRYLLRHETANAAHYRTLHPPHMDAEQRVACLWHLKDIGYQVGAGFLVGAPFQTTAHLLEDIRFLQRLQPEMIGVGPFLSHVDTPFSHHTNGSLPLCLRMLAILRLIFPKAMIPATTALGTAHPGGREMGLRAGCNVVMPNLSPSETRALYALYDHKLHTGEEAVDGLRLLRQRVEAAGYVLDMGIGNPR